MSGADTKKPETQEELIRIVAEAAQKSAKSRRAPKRVTTKPTILGTAKALNIHRDTLYTWLKEFNVDFKEILEGIPTSTSGENVEFLGSTYLIGESLVGEGNEVAHIDLLVGDKNGFC
jgi:hypothetical protein